MKPKIITGNETVGYYWSRNFFGRFVNKRNKGSMI